MKKINRNSHKINATNSSIGRLATKIATLLQGKNKTDFERHIDGGDIINVINIKNAKFSGKKIDQKKYHSHSGYPGGLKETKLKDLFAKSPNEVLRKAVKQMLPANKLREDMLKRLIIS